MLSAMSGAATPPPPDRRRRAARIALTLGAMLLLSELGLRLVGFELPVFHRWDAATGLRGLEGAEGWWRGEGGPHRLRFNRRGVRGPERVQPKPPGVLRVVLLGDSFTEALQVPYEHAYGAALEEHLARCPAVAPRRVETINLGVSGTGTAHQLLTLEHRGWDYQPDVVVLAFFPANDVRNNARDLEGNPNFPYFELRDGALVLDDAFRRRPAARWRKAPLYRLWLGLRGHSRTVQLLLAARRSLRIAAAGRSPDPLESGLSPQVYAPPTDVAWRRAWEVSEALILEAARRTRQHGARFLLATVPASAEAHPDAALRRRLAAGLGVPDLGYPERRLLALGRRHRLPVVALGAPLRAAAGDGTYLYGFPGPGLGRGHWNRRGHALAGRLIADALCRELRGSEDAENDEDDEQQEDRHRRRGDRQPAAAAGRGGGSLQLAGGRRLRGGGDGGGMVERIP